jgi:hypothetical protein
MCLAPDVSDPTAVAGAVCDDPAHRLSRDEVRALKFAAHRQLARWAKAGDLEPRRHARRAALVTAVRVLEARAFADGCELCVRREA